MDARLLHSADGAAIENATGLLFAMMDAAYAEGHDLDVQVDLRDRQIVILFNVHDRERVILDREIASGIGVLDEYTRLRLLALHVDLVLRRQALWVRRQNIALAEAERSVRARFPSLVGFRLSRM